MDEPTQAKPCRARRRRLSRRPRGLGRDAGRELAKAQGIELNDEHWLVIRFMRDYYAEHQICADARHAMKQLDSATPGTGASACSSCFPTATWRRPAASPACAGRAPGAPVEHSGRRPVDSRWRLSRLLTAPHRLGFFSAALMLATSALWWALALATRHAGVALPWAVPPPLAHGLVMAMGFMPLFIVGFLFTAGPRWLGLSDVPARSLRNPVLAMLAGWGLALAGFHLHEVLAGLGVALVAGGWSAVVLRFLRLLRSESGGRPVARPRDHRRRGRGRTGVVGRRAVAGRWRRHRPRAWPPRWRCGVAWRPSSPPCRTA